MRDGPLRSSILGLVSISNVDWYWPWCRAVSPALFNVLIQYNRDIP